MSDIGQKLDRGELLTKKEVSKLARLCARTLTLYVKRGLFPPAACVHDKRACWRRQDVLDYLGRLGTAASCTRGGLRYRRTAAERRAAVAGRKASA